MPTFDITAPDGTKYEVTGPEGSTPEQALAKVKAQHQPTTEAPKEAGASVSPPVDFVKSIPRGFLGGLSETATSLGSAEMGMMTGGDPEIMAGMPNKQQGTELLEQNVTGELPKPQGRAGKFGEAIGEVLGNPATYLGPGSLALKAGTGTASALTSEAAGQLTEGTAAEPYARFAGGVIGGGAAGAVAAERGAARLGAELPTHEAIKDSSKAAYKAIENSRLQANGPALNSLTTGIKANLENALIDESEAKAVFRAVDGVGKGDGGIASIMGLYEQLGKVGPGEGTKYAAAQIARENIQEWLGKLTPKDVLTGDAAFTQAMWDHARTDWLKHKKLEMLEQATTKAQRQASSTGTGANRINKARQAMEKILDSEKKSRGMSPESKAKLAEIVEGSAFSNRARNLSKYAPTSPVSLLAPLGVGEFVSASAGWALAAVGYIAKYFGEYLTDRQLRQLDELIRSESNVGKSILQQQAPARAELSTLAPAAAARGALTSPLAPGQ